MGGSTGLKHPGSPFSQLAMKTRNADVGQSGMRGLEGVLDLGC